MATLTDNERIFRKQTDGVMRVLVRAMKECGNVVPYNMMRKFIFQEMKRAGLKPPARANINLHSWSKTAISALGLEEEVFSVKLKTSPWVHKFIFRDEITLDLLEDRLIEAEKEAEDVVEQPPIRMPIVTPNIVRMSDVEPKQQTLANKIHSLFKSYDPDMVLEVTNATYILHTKGSI